MDILPEVQENQPRGMTKAKYEKTVERAKELDTKIAEMLPKLRSLVHERAYLFAVPSEFPRLLSTLNFYIDEKIPSPSSSYPPFEEVEELLNFAVTYKCQSTLRKTRMAESKV